MPKNPAAETPAPIEPSAPAVPPAPPQGPEGSSPAPKKRSRIWIPIVAVLALILLGLGAAAALFLMRAKGDDSSGFDLIADVASEPDDVWSYDFASSDDEFISSYPIVLELDDDSILIWGEIDPYLVDASQGDTYGWYDGYAEDYDAGYDAGVAFNVAYEAWYADETYTIAYPYEEDFYPEGASVEPPEGWLTGFYDAYSDLDRGSSAVQEPVEPDFSASEVVKLDLKTGDEIWALDVVDLVDDFDFYSGLAAYAVTDTDYTVFVGREESTSTATLISVENATGEVASEATFDDFSQLLAVDGGVFVLVVPGDGDDATLSRLDPKDLEADAVWEEDVDDAWAITQIGDDYVAVEGDGGGYVFDAADGSEPEWGKDYGDGVSYAFVGGQLVRSEYDDDEYEITGTTLEGESSWDDAVTAEWVSASKDGLFVADMATDGVENVMRLDPKTGAEMWDEAWGDEIYAGAGVIMAFSGIVAFPEVDSERLAVADVKTGEELFTERIKDTIGFWPGVNYFYMQSADELEAFNLKEGGSVWSYGFDEESETIFSIGDKLYVLDFEDYSISLLAEE